MKKLSFVFILSLMFTSLMVTAQYDYDDQYYGDTKSYPGYLGDNFSLEGALDIFKGSKDLQDFEYKINQDEYFVNNLDLNYDGKIDFIRVEDVSDNRSHRLIVLQAVLARKEVQDVAVIAIERTGNREATLQIIGDEYLFGPNLVVEPHEVAYNNSRNGYGPAGADVEIGRFFVNVYFWPSVRSLFRPRYSFYRSPYYYGYYPSYYSTWRPYSYGAYYNRCSPYRSNFFRVAPVVRINYFNNYYIPRRRTFAPTVRRNYRSRSSFYTSRNNGVVRRSATQTAPTRRSDFDRRRSSRTQFRNGNNGTAQRRNQGTVNNRNNRNVTPDRSATRSPNRGNTRGNGATRNADVSRNNNGNGAIRNNRNNAKSSRPNRSTSTPQRSTRNNNSATRSNTKSGKSDGVINQGSHPANKRRDGSIAPIQMIS